MDNPGDGISASFDLYIKLKELSNNSLLNNKSKRSIIIQASEALGGHIDQCCSMHDQLNVMYLTLNNEIKASHEIKAYSDPVSESKPNDKSNDNKLQVNKAFDNKSNDKSNDKSHDKSHESGIRGKMSGRFDRSNDKTNDRNNEKTNDRSSEDESSHEQRPSGLRIPKGRGKVN